MLGRKVAQTLMEATKSDEAEMLIGRAASKLRAQQEALRSYRVGAVYGYVEPGPAGDSTASLLEAARRLIKRCRQRRQTISVAAALPPAAAIHRRAWLLAAEQLQIKAIDEVGLARFRLQQMRGEIRLLFRDAGIMAHLA
ncbi:hypothetical protein ACQ4PT_044336 [Festuca glaucescens]